MPPTQIGGQCRLDLGHEHHPNAGRERCDIAPSIRRHYSRTLKESKLTSVDATDCTNGCSEVLSVCHTAAGESQWLKCVGRFHLRAQRQLVNLRRCATDTPTGSLRSGAGLPFWRGARFAFERVSFATHFHVNPGL